MHVQCFSPWRGHRPSDGSGGLKSFSTYSWTLTSRFNRSFPHRQGHHCIERVNNKLDEDLEVEFVGKLEELGGRHSDVAERYL
jgi:hypothetical protein